MRRFLMPESEITGHIPAEDLRERSLWSRFKKISYSGRVFLACLALSGLTGVAVKIAGDNLIPSGEDTTNVSLNNPDDPHISDEEIVNRYLELNGGVASFKTLPR